ncbi:hypothetical protein [Treponema sp. R80B11-R83G3]
MQQFFQTAAMSLCGEYYLLIHHTTPPLMSAVTGITIIVKVLRIGSRRGKREEEKADNGSGEGCGIIIGVFFAAVDVHLNYSLLKYFYRKYFTLRKRRSQRRREHVVSSIPLRNT